MASTLELLKDQSETALMHIQIAYNLKTHAARNILACKTEEVQAYRLILELARELLEGVQQYHNPAILRYQAALSGQPKPEKRGYSDKVIALKAYIKGSVPGDSVCYSGL